MFQNYQNNHYIHLKNKKNHRDSIISLKIEKLLTLFESVP